MSLNQIIFKTIRPIGGLKVARFLARRHPRILMYHRLSEDGRNGAITPDQFREHMILVKRKFNPLSLGQFLRLVDEGTFPKHVVIITFDDGYSDFATYAFPILRELGIPATIFVTTGFIDGKIWLWPDQLRYAIEKSKVVSIIELDEFNIRLDTFNYPERSWQVVADYCMTISNADKLRLIELLFNKLEVEFPSYIPRKYSALTWKQLRACANEGVEIGSHSHSHPILTKLSDDDLQKEVELSRSLINRNIEIDEIGFCYPNGQVQDFSERERRAVQNSGYRYAVSAYPSKNPIENRWSINRYPAGSGQDDAEKILYGLKYLNL